MNASWACSVRSNTIQRTDAGWDSVTTRARRASVAKAHGDEDQIKTADDQNGDRDQVNITADVDRDEDHVKIDDDRNGDGDRVTPADDRNVDHGQVVIADDQNEQKDQVMIENDRNEDEDQMMIAGDRIGQRDQTMIAYDRNEDKDQVMIADDFSDGDNQDEQLSLNVDYSAISKSKKLAQPPAVTHNSFGSESYAKPTKNISAPYSKYTGRYGNIAYGNISVDIVEKNATDGDEVWLIMRYGPIAKWRLEPIGLSHVFKAHGQEPFWYWRMFVWFRVNATAASHVTVLFDAETPPLFTRDLTFADAVASTSTN